MMSRNVLLTPIFVAIVCLTGCALTSRVEKQKDDARDEEFSWAIETPQEGWKNLKINGPGCVCMVVDYYPPAGMEKTCWKSKNVTGYIPLWPIGHVQDPNIQEIFVVGRHDLGYRPHITRIDFFTILYQSEEFVERIGKRDPIYDEITSMSSCVEVRKTWSIGTTKQKK